MELEIDLSEAYRYMGGRGAPAGEDRAELLKAAGMIREASAPRTTERFFTAEQRDGAVFLPEGGLLLPGKAVRQLLAGCTVCVLFCATLGAEPEKLIRKWEVRNIAFAAALDACASSAVESLCAAEEEKIRTLAGEQSGGKEPFLTDRFSPGYEDLPVSLQKDFCAALDTQRRIGVAVSGSGLMIPRKTVTAVVGLAEREQKHRESGCGACPAFSGCTFRERGVTCYGHIL